MDSPIPRPASGQVLLSKLEELERQMSGLIKAMQAMKREQERLNAIIAQQPAQRERGA